MKPFVHSFSSVSKFDTCPRQFEHRYILGNREPPTEHTMWGERVHTALEDRVNGKIAELPEGMTQMEWAVKPALAAKERGMLVMTEQKMALDRAGAPVVWDSGKAWMRAIVDVAILHGKHGFNSDYKTGKRRESWQLEMSSYIMFKTYPAVEHIEARYLWLKDSDPRTRTDKDTYHRDQTAHMAGKILPRLIKVEEALDSGRFPPKPSGLCRAHCPVFECNNNGRKR